MASELLYRFFHDGNLLAEGTIQAPFTAGRKSDEGEPDPVGVFHMPPASKQCSQNANTPRKLVLVPLSNRSMPRLSIRVEVSANGDIVAHNLHRAVQLMLANREVLAPQESATVGRNGVILFPDRYELSLARDEQDLSQSSVRFEDDNRSYLALDFGTNLGAAEGNQLLAQMSDEQTTGKQEVAIRMVRTVLEAFSQPPGSEEFFTAAGDAAIKMIDLDRVAVLSKQDGQWICRAQSIRPGLDREITEGRGFSHTLLNRMQASGKTMIVEPKLSMQSVWASIDEVDRAVASPILEEGKIVGAFYGDRALAGTSVDRPIGELEAAMLDVLATGISSSLAIEKEQQLRSSMSQFFSPLILSQLKDDQTLLEPKEAQVSVLFCDIRGFSAVTEKIGPTKAIEWINDVLTTLSQCVLDQDGVLVDYIGDELMAMWGAPGNQPDHAVRACRAAIDMLSQRAYLGKKWQDVVPNRFGFGIGINTGLASVGNTGSKKKFKYGPLGNTVNVASRVQGITKQLGIPGLMTGETAPIAKSASLQTRRIAQVRVVGIEKAIHVYQLCPSSSDQDLCERYERALDSYEKNDLKGAAGMLASMVQDYPEDRPTIMLLSRAVEALNLPDVEFNPIWILTEK